MSSTWAIPGLESLARFSMLFSTLGSVKPLWSSRVVPCMASRADWTAVAAAVPSFRAQPGLAPSQITPDWLAIMLFMVAGIISFPSKIQAMAEPEPMAAAMEQPQRLESLPI